MAWEALNNIAAGRDRNVVIVVNDNGRSYAPTIGGLADRLASLRLQPGYERVLEPGKDTLRRTPVVGRPIYAGLHALKAGVKDCAAPAGAVRRPRAEVLRAGRRARRRGDGVGAAPGPALRRPGDRARRHPQGLRLRARGERRRRADAQPGGVRPGDRPAHGPAPVGWTRCSPRRWWRSGTARRGRRRDHRGDARPDGAGAVRRGLPGPLLRRRHRRAARADLRGGPGRRRAAPRGRDLLDLPQPRLRPAADGRRAAPPGRHAGAGPGRRHRQRRAVATTACGTCRSCGVVPGMRVAAPGTPRRCARSWPRPSRSTTGRRRCASRRAR